MAFLYHLSPEGVPLESWVVEDGGLVVGRSVMIGASIQDNSLSRSHFLILREAGTFFLVDLESQNGTRVDGKPVDGVKLHDGGVIFAGQSVFYFSLERLPTHAPPILGINPGNATAALGAEKVQLSEPTALG